MAMLSYNEETQRRTIVRRFFIPTNYGLLCEIVIAVVALILFNLSQLSGQLASREFATTNPLSLWSQLLNQVLTNAQQHGIVQEALLFILWAIVGALVYILIFRLTQLFMATRNSVDEGVRIMHTGNTEGLLRWLASIHDIFLRVVIFVIAMASMAFAVLVCFSVASQELTNGLSLVFPNNIVALAISLIGAILSVRFIVIGVSLLSRRFRLWYNN